MRIFVVQRHAATHLHYDLRLEIDGVLKSWAVPKGPPETIGVRRLAILVKDHPLEFADFEGVIPVGHGGAGTVEIWDKGWYETEGSAPAAQQFERGVMELTLRGRILDGRYSLIRMISKKKKGGKPKDEWLLAKRSGGGAVTASQR